MRYYEIHRPGDASPGLTTNARRLRGLPEGTRVFAIRTERDGSLMEEQELQVKAGRVVFGRKNVHRPEPPVYRA